ncbi:MAG: asparagine synthase (glutamine-hydrolyzing) [Gemmatimonadetes bacterium]|nr:asparagine synthase (glutamine-hydrolyzing) [Gemmatimonadota bacterium]
MCGIAGFVGSPEPEERRRRDVEGMCEAMVHRGPDGSGYHVGSEVTLGMRRLSVIDPRGSQQPLTSEDGSIQLVLNGEIYNYRDLRSRLRSKGHEFRTEGDAESVVHLYEEYGDDCVRYLNGMFAFALWDGTRRRLLLARDRLGIKPLYLLESSTVAFASELQCFSALPGFDPEVDPASLGRYLALGYVPDPDSIYRGVRKLPPGHVATWSRGEGLQVKEYWSPVSPEDPTLDEGTAVEEIRRLLATGVERRLVADVPLGAFLSGGVDSSAVVAQMSRLMDRPPRTFSIGFREGAYDESPHAARVARTLGTEHTMVRVDPDVEALFETVALGFGEPFADSSALPTLLVSALARDSVTVALSGDGGDELFGGYERYRSILGRNVSLPAPVRRTLFALATRLPQGARGRNRLLELGRDLEGRYAGMVAAPLASREGGVALEGLAEAVGSLHAPLAGAFQRVRHRDPASQFMLVDLLTYLPGDILTKVDRMSMSRSLEVRVPLLDHEMVEFATKVPSSLKIRGGVGKWVFIKALEGLVPPGVFTRPKQGFAIPLAPWFRGPLSARAEGLAAPSSCIARYVNVAAVGRCVREHRSGRRDHSALLWRLLVLETWLARHRVPGSLGRPAELAAFLRRDPETDSCGNRPVRVGV